jgi:hypothetical protein
VLGLHCDCCWEADAASADLLLLLLLLVLGCLMLQEA